MPAFTGKFYYTVDPKGRIMMPAPFREILSANYGQKLYVANDAFENCLVVYPHEEWARLTEKIRSQPKSDKAVKYFMKKVIASAKEVETDSHGRILIPSELRDDGGISGEVVIAGQVEKIEVWSKKVWDEMMNPVNHDLAAYEKSLSDRGI